MSHDIDVFHHIGLVGHDLGRLAAQYERLGFTLTPVSIPRFPLSPGGAPEPVGAGNRHAIFRNSYLELLGVLDRPRWDSIPAESKGAFDLDRPLARYEGLHVLHLGTDDLDAVRGRLEREGLRPSEEFGSSSGRSKPKLVRKRCARAFFHCQPAAFPRPCSRSRSTKPRSWSCSRATCIMPMVQRRYWT